MRLRPADELMQSNITIINVNIVLDHRPVLRNKIEIQDFY